MPSKSLSKFKRLEADLQDQLRGARQAAQSAIVEAESEVDALYREALAEAEAEANRTRETSPQRDRISARCCSIQLDESGRSAQLPDHQTTDGCLMTVFFPLIASEGGFGINLNLFETNLINLVIVIGVLYWFLKGFLGGMLQSRRETILRDLKMPRVVLRLLLLS